METTLSPRLPTAAAVTFGEIANAYMLAYRGRDPSRGQRVGFWQEHLRTVPLLELDADRIDAGLVMLETAAARTFVGRRGDGSPIYRARKGPLAPATINLYIAALGAVLTWSRKRRLLPRHWVSPLKEIHREPVSNGRVRFLSTNEYARLLVAARASAWPRLWLLIVLGVTTGARRGAFEALRWRDINLEAGRAWIARTKNDQPHTLVLVPEALAELRRFAGKPEELVFPSARKPGRPFKWNKAFALSLADARIEGAVFHTLRHTHASWLASHGASLLEIAESMSHKSLKMAQRYAHLTVDHRAALVSKVFA